MRIKSPPSAFALPFNFSNELHNRSPVDIVRCGLRQIDSGELMKTVIVRRGRSLRKEKTIRDTDLACYKQALLQEELPQGLLNRFRAEFLGVRKHNTARLLVVTGITV